MHFSFFKTPKLVPKWRITSANEAIISRPFGSYAPMQPNHKQYSCGTVEERQFLFRDELVALCGGKPHGIALTLKIQEELGAVFVFPAARVYFAAAQPNDHGQMLNAYGTLIFAGAAGCALKYGFLRNGRAHNRRFARVAILVEVSPKTESNLLGVQLFPRVVRGAVLRTASAFDTGVNLQRGQLCKILACVQTKIVIAGRAAEFC